MRLAIFTSLLTSQRRKQISINPCAEFFPLKAYNVIAPETHRLIFILEYNMLAVTFLIVKSHVQFVDQLIHTLFLQL